MQKKNADEVLNLLIEHLIICLEELRDFTNTEKEAFQYGERVAYTECLECIQFWAKNFCRRLNFDIENTFPL